MHTLHTVTTASIGVALGAAYSALETTSSGATVGRPPKATNSAPNPISGFPESWGLTRHDMALITAGAVIALLLLIVLTLRVRRRRRAEDVNQLANRTPFFPQSAHSWRGTGMAEEPTGPLPRFKPQTMVTTTAEPGWHAIEGDQKRIAYWDGTHWVAQRTWDGSQWVEAAKTKV